MAILTGRGIHNLGDRSPANMFPDWLFKNQVATEVQGCDLLTEALDVRKVVHLKVGAYAED